MKTRLHPAINLVLSIAIFFGIVKACNACSADEMAQMEQLKESDPAEWRNIKVKSLVDPDGSVDEVEFAIQQLMNDPSSYEHISTQFDPVGNNFKVITNFRGKNSFGAIVPHSAEALIDIEGTILELKMID